MDPFGSAQQNGDVEVESCPLLAGKEERGGAVKGFGTTHWGRRVRRSNFSSRRNKTHRLRSPELRAGSAPGSLGAAFLLPLGAGSGFSVLRKQLPQHEGPGTAPPACPAHPVLCRAFLLKVRGKGSPGGSWKTQGWSWELLGKWGETPRAARGRCKPERRLPGEDEAERRVGFPVASPCPGVSLRLLTQPWREKGFGARSGL